VYILLTIIILAYISTRRDEFIFENLKKKKSLEIPNENFEKSGFFLFPPF